MLTKKLFEMQDTGYRDFQSRLMPTVDCDTIIGVRTPQIRKLAKETTDAADFLSTLPHRYYEENNLHAFLIEKIKDFDECITETEKFLPYINNWATCDSFCPKVFKQHREKLLSHIEVWLKSEHTYTVRFAIGMLMKLYLDEYFSTEYLQTVSGIKSDEYYINMMIAWYFATALTKHYDVTLPYLEKNKLGIWIHNKTIQKATESFRITDEQKTYLKTLKRVLD